MSVALIQESAKEVRRLAIAGSPLAVGDFRLKKLIAPLEQAGANVPVFAQVAKAIGELVNGNEADSAARLLSLSTLLNAVLYTQGQSGADAGFQELEMFSAGTSTTRAPARVLKPIVEALTTTGGGRFEVVKEAFDRGTFNDLRLIEPAIRALDDTYPGLADLVAEKILPAYGAGIVPLLKQKLDLKGKKSDARRLFVMHQLDPNGTIELCKTALEDGSPEVKICAIGCLGKHEDFIPLVMEQSNSKNKTVRAAALEALAAHDRPEIFNLFMELIKGKTLDILAQPLRAMRNRQVLNSLLDEGRKAFELMLKGDEEQIPRYCEVLDCLAQRSDAEGEAFLIDCFDCCARLATLKPAKNSSVAGADLICRLASLLYGIGSPATLAKVLDKRELIPPVAFSHVLRSALRLWPAEKVFEEFAALLEQKKGAGKEKSEELQRTILRTSLGKADLRYLAEIELNSLEAQFLANAGWDPRWLDAAIKANEARTVCCLARPGHKAAVAYLLKLGDTKNELDHEVIIEGLARCQYPQITDVFLDLVAKKTKGASHFNYRLQLMFGNARYLSAADLPKLDAFAAKLDEKFVDKFLEAIEPLRPSKQPD